jgi:hypothetical protein
VIICPACTNENTEELEWCSGCGEYLVWDGRPAAAEAASEPGPPPLEPEHSRQTFIARVREIVTGPDRHAQECTPIDELLAPADCEDAVAGPIKPQPGAVAPRRLDVAKQRRPRLVPVSSPAAPGQLICGMCGTGNDPERRFCCRCAASLTDAERAPDAPWWRRPRKAPPSAGERPRRRRRTGRRLVGLAVVAGLIAGLITFASPISKAFGKALDSIRDGLRRPQQVEAFQVQGSPSVRHHEPDKAFDGDLGTYWAPRGKTGCASKRIVITFPRTVDLALIKVYSGISSENPQFARFLRPRTVRLTSQTGDTKELVLEDRPSEQEQDVRLSDVRTLRLDFIDDYKPRSKHPTCGVTEFEIFARR